MKMHIVIGALLMIAGCSSEREASPPSASTSTRLAEPTGAIHGEPQASLGGAKGVAPIDQALMLALGQARNYHHKAKILMTDGNLPEAAVAVRQILALSFPEGAPEAEDVRNDARALLAKLLVGQGQLDEAARTVDDGIAQSPRESFFVANLYTVQGEIHEARAAGLDASEAAKAADERRAAIASYDRSIQINERLQKQLVEDRP